MTEDTGERKSFVLHLTFNYNCHTCCGLPCRAPCLGPPGLPAGLFFAHETL